MNPLIKLCSTNSRLFGHLADATLCCLTDSKLLSDRPQNAWLRRASICRLGKTPHHARAGGRACAVPEQLAAQLAEQLGWNPEKYGRGSCVGAGKRASPGLYVLHFFTNGERG